MSSQEVATLTAFDSVDTSQSSITMDSTAVNNLVLPRDENESVNEAIAAASTQGPVAAAIAPNVPNIVEEAIEVGGEIPSHEGIATETTVQHQL
jgi:hypothetical protein